jgi:hypothetical protein
VSRKIPGYLSAEKCSISDDGFMDPDELKNELDCEKCFMQDFYIIYPCDQEWGGGMFQ